MPFLSIVVPTRDRPLLLRSLLDSIDQSDVANIEVIIADNPSDDISAASSSLSFEHWPWVKYRRNPRDADICENFEWGLSQATGDFVTFLTDKMSWREGALELLVQHLRAEEPDIANWADVIFTPHDGLAPLGGGSVVGAPPVSGKFKNFDPHAVLKKKANGKQSRREMEPFEYLAGKIVFGTYSRRLLSVLEKCPSGVFRGATHDYAASIQALNVAQKCTFFSEPLVVHVSLPQMLSTGSSTDYSAATLRDYIHRRSDSLGWDLLSALPIPGLYSSVHNVVAHDIRLFSKQADGSDRFNLDNWFPHFWDDLLLEGKIWESEAARVTQINLLETFEQRHAKRRKFGFTLATPGTRRLFERARRFYLRALEAFRRRAGFRTARRINVESLDEARLASL